MEIRVIESMRRMRDKRRKGRKESRLERKSGRKVRRKEILKRKQSRESDKMVAGREDSSGAMMRETWRELEEIEYRGKSRI